jgi:hypothetical protein
MRIPIAPTPGQAVLPTCVACSALVEANGSAIRERRQRGVVACSPSNPERGRSGWTAVRTLTGMSVTLPSNFRRNVNGPSNKISHAVYGAKVGLWIIGGIVATAGSVCGFIPQDDL